MKGNGTSLKSKMFLALTFIIFCFLLGFLLIFLLIRQMDAQVEQLSEWNDYALQAQEVSSTFQEKYIFINNIYLYDEPDYSRFHTLDERMDTILLNLEAAIENEEAQSALERLQFFNEMFNTRVQQYVTLEIVPSSSTLDGFGYLNAEMRTYASELESYFNLNAERSEQEMQAAMQQAVIGSLLVFVIATSIGSVIFWVVAQRISTIIRKISNRARRVASGDLSRADLPVKGRDELSQLAQNINLMTNQLRSMIVKLSGASQTITSSSQELVATTTDVNSGAETVTNSVQHIAEQQSELHESINRSKQTFTIMDQEIVHAASSLQTIVTDNEQSYDQVVLGQKKLQQSVDHMLHIKTQNDHHEKTIVELNQAVEDIHHVVTNIKNISNQTSLLALNANIEASRAGRSGRGFAVVAEEVGKLALESEHAANQITETISSMAENIQSSTVQSKKSTDLITEGTYVLDELATTYAQFLEAFQTVQARSLTIHRFVSAVKEQSAAVSNELYSIQQSSEDATANSTMIAATIEEQTATMDAITFASKELATIVEDLEKLFTQFKLSS